MKRFLRSFGEHFSDFKYQEQQDVHEFLSCLLLSLDEDINIAGKFGKPMDTKIVDRDQSKMDKLRYFRDIKR